MPFDAFTLKHTVNELNIAFVGAKINKVNQPNKEDIILSVYNQGKNKKIIISCNAQNARISTTSRDRENPAVAPNFCMLLRKHILGGEILSISQVEFERIINIDILCKNDLFENYKKTLCVEIMGKYSNIILLQDGVILGAMKVATLDVNATRPLFSGLKYVLPKKQDKIDIFNKDKAISYLANYTNQHFSKYLFDGFSGIADQTAKELENRYSYYISNPENFYNKMIDFILNIDIKPTIISNPNFTDYIVYDTTLPSYEKKYFANILEMIEYFFDKKENEKDFNLKLNALLSKINFHIKKLEKKKVSILDTINSCKTLEDNKIKGELILSNIYKIKRGDKILLTQNFYSENLEEIKIVLDDKLSPQDNANRYFKKYTKQKTALKYAETNLKQIQDELNYLYSVKTEIENCSDVASLIEVENEMVQEKLIISKGKIKKTNPFRTYLFEDFTIVMGKNNISNDALREQSKGNDLWFHVKNYHSPFVVAKACDKPFTDKLKLFCAQLCAYYSESKDTVEVDYTLIKYVKKPPKSRPGTVIYTNQESIFVTPKKHNEYEIK